MSLCTIPSPLQQPATMAISPMPIQTSTQWLPETKQVQLCITAHDSIVHMKMKKRRNSQLEIRGKCATQEPTTSWHATCELPAQVKMQGASFQLLENGRTIVCHFATCK